MVRGQNHRRRYHRPEQAAPAHFIGARHGVETAPA
jgi:hypothetical protein